MCRVLFFASQQPSKLPRLLEGLARAAEKDPYLAQVSQGLFHSHGDGWGYTVYAERMRRGLYSHYRSRAPIYGDPDGMNLLVKMLDEAELAIGIVHARKAGRGEPVSALDSHPFHAATPQGWEMWLAHNGTVYKEALVRDAGLPEGLLARTDSLALTLYLASSRSLREALRTAAARYTRTALNLGILLASPKTPRLVVASYFRYGPGEPRHNYYKLYRARLGWGVVFASSTLVSHLKIISGETPHPGNYYAEAWPEEGEILLVEDRLI